MSGDLLQDAQARLLLHAGRPGSQRDCCHTTSQLRKLGRRRTQTGQVNNKESPPVCSAKGCRAVATWALVWNNPRLHVPGREKVWVACDEHKQWLADYLTVRSFLNRVEPLETI